MSRFLHTADLHLNAQRRRFDNYLRRAEWVLTELTKVAEVYKCDCIVVAGDIFDRTDLTIAERNLFSTWLGEVTTPVLAITGNHDKRGEDIGNTCLSYLTKLRLDRHLIHDGDPRIVHAFGVTWLLLPYQKWTHQEFYLIVLSMVKRARKKWDTPIVAVVHEAVQGSHDDTGLPVTQPNQIKITEDMGVDYWALGDIHLSQKILPNAYYCGSPQQMRFSEREDKGVLIVDTENLREPKFVFLESPFPLVTLTKAPDGEWPGFAVFRPREPYAGEIPAHVVYEPEALVTSELPPVQHVIGVLDGLVDHLQRFGLAEKLIPIADKLANQMLEELASPQD